MTETTGSLIKTPDLDLRAAMRDPFAIVPQVLDLVRLNGAIFFRSHFRSPWAYTSPPVLELAGALPPAPGSLVLFHIVAEGNCWIALGDGIKRHLSRGDVVVMPYADAYASGSEEEAEPISITSLLPPPPWTTFPQIDYGGDGENTRMVCGYSAADAVLFDPVPGHCRRCSWSNRRALRCWVTASVEYAMQHRAELNEGKSTPSRAAVHRGAADLPQRQRAS
jgi:hypothetical protein